MDSGLCVCRVCLYPSGGVHSVQWRVHRRPRWQRFFGPVRVGDRGGCPPVGLNPDCSTPGGIPTTTVLRIADDHVGPPPAGPIGHGMRHGVQHASGRVFPVWFDIRSSEGPSLQAYASTYTSSGTQCLTPSAVIPPRSPTTSEPYLCANAGGS